MDPEGPWKRLSHSAQVDFFKLLLIMSLTVLGKALNHFISLLPRRGLFYRPVIVGLWLCIILSLLCVWRSLTLTAAVGNSLTTPGLQEEGPCLLLHFWVNSLKGWQTPWGQGPSQVGSSHMFQIHTLNFLLFCLFYAPFPFIMSFLLPTCTFQVRKKRTKSS